jgi:hypothetical protein
MSLLVNKSIGDFSDFQKKLTDTSTTNNFYLKSKENNENDMAAQVFWAVFYSIRRSSQIGPTADFDGAAIPQMIPARLIYTLGSDLKGIL